MKKVRVLKLRQWVIALATVVFTLLGCLLFLMGAWRYDIVGKIYQALGFVCFLTPILLLTIEIKVEIEK